MTNSHTINFIRFDDLFDEPLIEREKYFQNLPKKETLLTLINWLNNPELIGGALETRNKHQIGLLDSVLQKSDHLSRMKLVYLRQLEVQENFKLLWVMPHTCLDVIDHLLSNYSKEIFNGELFDINEASKVELTDNQKFDIVKGYFAFANSRLDKISTSFNVPFQELVRRQFIERIGTYELERSDDPLIFYVEFIKSIEFLDFLESAYKGLLHYLLLTKGLRTRQEYSLKISGFFDQFIENIQVKVESGPEKDRDVQFFDSLISPNAYLKPRVNFLNLKVYPLLKYDENRYLLIYRTFVFEKIYKTLYFEVQHVAKREKISLDKSDLGKKYFEEWLCSKFVNKIFTNKKIINLEGTNPIFKKAKIEPDHYIRNWNDVFIFEYKDVLITDTSKVAYKAEVVLDELYTKLVKKSSGKNSAVIQLANFIFEFESQHRVFDPSAQTNRLTFYPILVVQDRCLSTPGINQILNDWFREIVDNDSNLRTRIKRLVIINIDCFINYINLFEGNPLAFKKCLLEYLKFELKAEKLRLFYSFDIWMRREYLHKENRYNLVWNYMDDSYKNKKDELIRSMG